MMCHGLSMLGKSTYGFIHSIMIFLGLTDCENEYGSKIIIAVYIALLENMPQLVIVL